MASALSRHMSNEIRKWELVAVLGMLLIPVGVASHVR